MGRCSEISDREYVRSTIENRTLQPYEAAAPSEIIVIDQEISGPMSQLMSLDFWFRFFLQVDAFSFVRSD